MSSVKFDMNWGKLLTIALAFLLMSAGNVSADSTNGEKVIVIGLDGADWKVMEPLIEKDKLPNIQKVMLEGDRSNVTSSIPSMSPVAWTTFATGKNPGKHSIYSFMGKKGDDLVPLTSRDITSDKLWDITSKNNMDSIIVNVPMTYPPQKIQGKLISGYLSIENTTYTYPESLQKEIESNGYKIEALSDGFEPGKEDEFLDKLNRTVEKRTEIFTDLMEDNNWNLSVVVYTGLDRLQHYFWKYMEEDSEHRNSIEDHYIKLDRQIGKILDRTDEDTEVIIMSDHGFGPLEGEVYVNNWLQEKGYLKMENQGILENLGLTQQNIASTLKSLGIFGPVKSVMEFLGLYDKTSSIPKPSYDQIDFENSKAFAGNFGGQIYVTADNYEEVRNEIRQGLKNMKNPETQENFFSEVYKKEEIYQGGSLDRAPDLVIGSENWDPVGFLGYSGLYSTDIDKSGKHRQEGIVVTNFKLDEKNVHLKDISPTVLEMLGLEVPEDMGGKILLE